MAVDDLLMGLRALANARQVRGDSKLVLNPDPLSFELSESPNEFDGNAVQGLVLEPHENAPFEMCSLAKRKHASCIEAFCDGTRSTYFVGYESDLPIIFTRNASVVRTRDKTTGYHTSLYNIQRHQAMLLAPFAQFTPSICLAYERLKLYSNRLADLCWTGLEEGYAPKPSEMETMGNLAWQRRARRRARLLLDLSEQFTSITGAQLLREQDPTGRSWLLKDGSLFQFKREYVRQANHHDANHMSGVVRLDIAAIDGWRDCIDEVSWAVLDEFYGVSAMPDPRYDVMPYGIYDCEQFLKSRQLPGDLLLAQLR